MSMYQQNLAVASERFGDLGKYLEQFPRTERVEVVTNTPSGYPTFYYTNEQNQRMLVHSMYNPWKEAYQFIEGKDFSEVRMVFVLGLGFAYHIQQFLKNPFFKGDIYVIEPSWEVFRAALEYRDLSDILTNKRVHLVIDPDQQKIKDIIFDSGLFNVEVYKSEFIYLPAYRRLFDEYYCKILDALNVKLTVNAANLFAAEELSQNWERNTLANLSDIFRSAPITSFYNRFNGVPGILVAAGPSLDKNIQLLKNAQSKTVIVCVGTALRPLLRAGIRPDFVLAMDSSDITLAQYEGITDTAGMWLCAEVAVSPKIIKLFSPRVSFYRAMENPLFSHFYDKEEAAKSYLVGGGSVSNSGLRLMNRMGFDPIVFVGLDLCVEPDGRSHASGTMHEGRCLPVEQKELGFFEIPGNYEPVVVTPKNFYVFIRWTEAFIAKNPGRRYINASAGGARIEGATLMPLDQVLEKYLSDTAVDTAELFTTMLRERLPQISRPIRKRVAVALRELKTLHKYFERGSRMSQEMVAVVEGKKGFKTEKEERKFSAKVKKFFTRLGEFKTFKLFDNTVKIDSHLMSFTIRNTRINEQGYSQAILRMPGMFDKLKETSRVFREHFERLVKQKETE